MESIEIKTDKIDGILFIRLIGEIGLSEEYTFRNEVSVLIEKEPPKLAVDLSEISLLSSYGISAIIGLWKRQNKSNNKMAIICPQNHVYDSLVIAGTDKIIPLFKTENQLINYYSNL